MVRWKTRLTSCWSTLTNAGIRCYLPCVSLIFIPLWCSQLTWLDSGFAFMTACHCRRHFQWCIFKCAHVRNVRVESGLVLHHADYYLRLLPTKLYTFCVGYRDRGHVGGQQLWSITAGSRTVITLAVTWASPPPPCGVSVAIIDLSIFF